MSSVRSYLTELDLDVEETRRVLDNARRWKDARKRREISTALGGRHVALYFEKPSVRTRLSFTVAVHELGGHAVELGPHNTKVGKGEDIADFARVVGRYAHALVARVFAQASLEAMARAAGVPVINALSDDRHPCQALADVMTIEERFGKIEGLKIAFIGEGNNVAVSLALLAKSLGAEVRVAAPRGYGIPPAIRVEADRIAAGALVELVDPREAAAGANVLYTDTWVSMGQESTQAARREAFKGYTIDGALMGRAAPGAIAMHCLPAVRGEEIAGDVLDGPASAIWDQAENRLHVQKALLVALLSV